MSGLNQRFTKPSILNWIREFESHRLRKQNAERRFLFGWRADMGCLRVRFENLLSLKLIL
jgi:hypothetical protein